MRNDPEERAQGGRLLDDRYRLLEQLDRGGAGVVWRAHDERLGRDVAVKILGAEADSAFRQRFEDEARRAARVSHPNVVDVYDEGQDGSDAYMVMELVRGKTLRDLIADRGPLPPDEAARIVRQVAGALDAAHAAGVVHLDVKPANIIVSTDGTAKLAAFGVAAAAHGRAERELVGTARYVAPERIEGAAPDPRSDVYSLGLVAFELLAGQPAFAGVETDDLVRLRLEGPPPSLRTVRIGIAPELERAIAKALARHPAERYRTAGEFARALFDAAGRDATAALTLAAPRGPRLPALGLPRLPLPRWDSALATLTVLLILLGLVAFFLNFPRIVAPLGPAATQAPQGPTTPNVVGLKLDKALERALDAGYVGIAYDVDRSLRGAPCAVGRQSPAAGAAVPRGAQLVVFYVPGRDCADDLD